MRAASNIEIRFAPSRCSGEQNTNAGIDVTPSQHNLDNLTHLITDIRIANNLARSGKLTANLPQLLISMPEPKIYYLQLKTQMHATP